MKSNISKKVKNGIITKQFLNNKIEKLADVILAELGNMRQENRELYNIREQLYHNDLRQENKLSDHEERIIKLEIAQ